MAHPVTLGKQGFFATLRRDKWWVEPALVASILTAFGIYATISAVLMQTHFEVGPYLSPLYEPIIKPSWWPFSPAILILWAPLGFRGTCYYYRKAGYRSLFFAPAACAVPEPHKTYTGERKFPLVALNLHRYFFYGALVFGLLNIYDGIQAFHGKDGGFGIGLGTLIIWINLVFLWLYTLSCHACRHIVGGRLKNFSKHPMRYRYWTFVSKLNPRHGTFAMTSLFTVILTDFYIMALAAGWFSDLRIIN